jgi:hypothetical protein
MRNLIYLTDFYEQVTAADMLWLYSRIADDDDFKSFDDHKMFRFCLGVISFDAPEELWKDLIRQGGDLAVMVAEDVFEDDTDEEGNFLPGRRDFDPTNPRNIHLYLEIEGPQHTKTLANDSGDSEIDKNYIDTNETPESLVYAGSHSRIEVQGGEDVELANNDILIMIGTSTIHDGGFESEDDEDDIRCLRLSKSDGYYGSSGEESPI